MAKVQYVGPCDAVDIPTGFGGWQTVVHGGVFDTTDDQAASMLEQPANWQSVAPAKDEKSAPKPDNSTNQEDAE